MRNLLSKTFLVTSVAAGALYAGALQALGNTASRRALPSVENCRRRGPLYPHVGLITITGIDDHLRPEPVITFHWIG